MMVQLHDGIVFDRKAIRFPLELRKPEGMRVDEPGTWPKVDGRVELVGGRLLYMPPCADVQQDVAVDVAYVLRSWSASTPGFVVGGNEAGMKLADEVRGADAAVWRRQEAEPRAGKFRRVPPILAVEVAGEDEDETTLREKAQWYLEHGVEVVWLVLPDTLEVVVLQQSGEQRFAEDGEIAEHRALPGLRPKVRALFAQLLE